MEIYSDEKTPKLRSDLQDLPIHEGFSFPEILFFVVVFQKRVEAALDNLSSLQDLENLINLAKMTPFPLIGLLKGLNKKYYFGLVADIISEPWITSCEPKSTTNQKNILKFAKRVQNLFLQSAGGVISTQYERLNKYIESLTSNEELNSSPQKSIRSSLSKSEKHSVNKENMMDSLEDLPGKRSLGKIESKRRGRPANRENTANDVETHYQAEMTELKKKESLKAAEDRLKKWKKLPTEKEKALEIEELQEKIQRVKLWQEEFKKAEKESKEINTLLNDMTGLDFRVNEMVKAIEYRRVWLLWRNSAIAFKKKLQEKKETKNKSKEGTVKVADLEQIVMKGKGIRHVFTEDDLLKELTEKFELVREIQEKIKEDSSLSDEELEKMEESLKHLNIIIPEAQILKKKIVNSMKNIFNCFRN